MDCWHAGSRHYKLRLEEAEVVIVFGPIKPHHRRRLFKMQHQSFSWTERFKVVVVMVGFILLFLYMMAILVTK